MGLTVIGRRRSWRATIAVSLRRAVIGQPDTRLALYQALAYLLLAVTAASHAISEIADSFGQARRYTHLPRRPDRALCARQEYRGFTDVVIGEAVNAFGGVRGEGKARAFDVRGYAFMAHRQPGRSA